VSTKEFVVTLKGKEKGGGRSNIGLWWVRDACPLIVYVFVGLVYCGFLCALLFFPTGINQ
jgi:hypothetical protein